MAENQKKKAYESVLAEAYRLYQLDWLAGHGKDLGALALAVRDAAMAGEADGNPYELIADALGGECFACRDEFEQAEFLDARYMRSLFSGNKFRQYQAVTGNRDAIPACPFISVETPAGHLVANVEGTAESYPGISVTLSETADAFSVDTVSLTEYDTYEGKLRTVAYTEDSDEAASSTVYLARAEEAAGE